MKTKSYTHKGKKHLNEDFLSFNPICFIVCDGVGGSTKGDVASSSIVSFLLKNNFGQQSKTDIIKAIIAAQKNLNNLVKKNPSYNGMATTIASIFLTKHGIFTAHIGDSRVYFIKPQQKLFWQTWDHSVTSELIKNNEITREAGRRHPLNNQIFRAIKGNLNGSITEPEIHFLSDIDAGDICFICSDGISEAFSDFELLDLLSKTENSIEDKLEQIKTRCASLSNDNNSAIIVEFEMDDVDHYSDFSSAWMSILDISY